MYVNVCRLRKMSYASQSCLWIRFPLINQSVDGKILTSSMSTSVVLWGLILKSDSWQNQSHCHIVDMTWATTTDSEGPGQIPLTWTFLTGRYSWTYLQIRLNELVGLTLKICMYKWISCDIMGGGGMLSFQHLTYKYVQKYLPVQSIYSTLAVAHKIKKVTCLSSCHMN